MEPHGPAAREFTAGFGIDWRIPEEPHLPRSLPLAVALCLLPPALLADAVEAAVEARLGDTDALVATLQHLTEGIGPRLTGSPALVAAHRFAAERYQSMGLGAGLEPFPLARSWERGPAGGEMVGPYRQLLHLAQVGWTPATAGTAQGAVRTFTPRTAAEMESYRGKLKGAIVLLGEPATNLEPLMMVLPLRVDPKVAEPSPKAEGLKMIDKVAFLRREGALAYVLDAGKAQGLLDMRNDDLALDGREGIPGVLVIHEQYLLLSRLVPTGATVRLRLEGRLGPAVDCFNTVATLRGVEVPDEYVVLGAHLDSWDLGTGATDNGAGATAVIEAARLLAEAGARPRRSIRFVLFSGEEQGLLGSKAYVERHAGELARHSAVFVIDTGSGRIDALALQGRAEVEPIVRRVLEPLVSLGVVDTDLRLEWGSDHLPFDEAGVPAFCFEQVQHDYSRNHHSEADTLDKVKPVELQQAAVVMALTAYRTAQLPEPLPRRSFPAAPVR